MAVRPTIATIDLDALRHNLATIRSRAPTSSICAVVKADGYGHGSVRIAQTLEREGVEWFAVALIAEGIRLRKAGIKTPILILGSYLTGGYEELVEHDLTPAISSVAQLKELAAIATQPTSFHLKLDTGMSRLGLKPEELPELLDALIDCADLKLDGIMTHLANADLRDAQANGTQLEQFTEALTVLEERAIKPRWVHVSNSAGILTLEHTGHNLLRPGLMLYGINPIGPDEEDSLQPVMRWTTRPVLLKEIEPGARVSYGGRFEAQRKTRLAVLPVGYADGYQHCFEGQASVLIRGQRAPIVGSICMDLCMADITDIEGVELDDEVVLMGRQGTEEISAYDLAGWARTIPYEMTCGVSQRVPRYYVDQEE